MTAPMDLFSIVPPSSADPAWLMVPMSPIERSFKAFHDANPHVYRELERCALRESARSRRLSISKMVEQIRADRMIETANDPFKINNNFRALYARLLMHRHTELDGRFEVRERRESGKEEAHA